MIYQINNNDNSKTKYEIRLTNVTYLNNSGEDHSSFSLRVTENRNLKTKFRHNKETDIEEEYQYYHATICKKENLHYKLTFKNNF